MKINLSDSEWKLMNHLWTSAPKTITELTAELREETGWSKNTVITMLSRLEAKGAVRHEAGLRAKRYFPSLRREDAADGHRSAALDQVISIAKTTSEYVELDTKAKYLQTNSERLSEQKNTLNEQVLDIEQVDLADAISTFCWDLYCYNAALKIGNQLLSQSLIDYMN